MTATGIALHMISFHMSFIFKLTFQNFTSIYLDFTSRWWLDPSRRVMCRKRAPFLKVYCKARTCSKSWTSCAGWAAKWARLRHVMGSKWLKQAVAACFSTRFRPEVVPLTSKHMATETNLPSAARRQAVFGPGALRSVRKAISWSWFPASSSPSMTSKG